MSTEIKQQIEEMKPIAEKARDAYPNVAWFTVADLQRSRIALSVVCSEHVAQASPTAILALIAEIERLERENERLRGSKAESAIPPQTCYDKPWWG